MIIKFSSPPLAAIFFVWGPLYRYTMNHMNETGFRDAFQRMKRVTQLVHCNNMCFFIICYKKKFHTTVVECYTGDAQQQFNHISGTWKSKLMFINFLCVVRFLPKTTGTYLDLFFFLLKSLFKRWLYYDK